MNVLRCSEIKHLINSPAHLIAEREKQSTISQELGTSIHCALLQPEKFNTYIIFDETEIIEELTSEGFASPRSTKKYKEWKSDFGKKNSGYTIISLETSDICNIIKENIDLNPYASTLLTAEGICEKRIYFDIEEVEITGQPDKIVYPFEYFQNGAIIDIKSCQKADEKSFVRDFWKYRYDIQASLYQYGVKKTYPEFENVNEIPFFIIAVETVAPYGIIVYEIKQEDLNSAYDESVFLIKQYKLCETTGYYNSYENKIITIEKPNYMKRG